MTSRTAADCAIVNCRVRTLDPERPQATGIALRDGVIVYVGDSAAVRQLCDARTEVIDGRGLVLVPGLVDSHQHALAAPEFAVGADCTAVQSLDEFRAAMAVERERVGSGRWVLGWGLAYNVFGSSELSGSVIEDAVGGQPALVRTMDGHTGIATKRALELAGVTGSVQFASGSSVICRDGVPTGELREDAAIDLVAAAIPPLTRAESKAMVLDVLHACNALGLTSIHLMDGNAESLQLARDLEESGELTMRLVVPVWHKPETTAEEVQAELALRDRRGKLWRGGVVKLYADGVIDTGTAWLVEPDTRGGSTDPFWPDPGRYAEAVRVFAEAGFQCATHATGDGGVRNALNAYRSAGARSGVKHRIEHIETLQDADLTRFAVEGVVASMQPLHMQWRKDDGSDWWTQMLGPERTARAWRCRDLLEAGAIVPLGSDWPVASYDPRVGMAWARLRREPKTDRVPFEPKQQLTGLQALEGYTTMAARAVGEEAVAGRIVEGLRADLTGFAEDPVECDPDDLVDLPVRLTVVDGHAVWRA